MKMVLGFGCFQDKIIFANPIKTQAQLEFAAKHNVRKMTFDSEEELEKIARHCPKAEVVLRIGTAATDAKWELSSKFGASMSDIPKLLQTAKRLKLKLIGVSFHVGTGGVSFTSYEESLRNARKVFDLVEKIGMEPLRLLDIGGGYAMCKIDPAHYEQRNFTAVAPLISFLIDELFDEDVEVIGEPGTFVVESSLYLLSRIIGTKTIARGEEVKKHYYINNGLYKGYMLRLFDEPQYLRPLDPAHEKRPKHSSTYWGQTCDSCDYVFKDRKMPLMNYDEWVITAEAGAYVVDLSTPFNGFDEPKIHYIRK